MCEVDEPLSLVGAPRGMPNLPVGHGHAVAYSSALVARGLLLCPSGFVIRQLCFLVQWFFLCFGTGCKGHGGVVE